MLTEHQSDFLRSYFKFLKHDHEKLDKIFNELVVHFQEENLISFIESSVTSALDLCAKEWNPELLAEIILKCPENYIKEKSRLSDSTIKIFDKFSGLALEASNAQNELTYTGGLLACAEINSRKKDYIFSPTVLKGSLEFSDYLLTLKQAEITSREKFIICDEHWLVGDIKISENNHVDIFILDSLGAGTHKMMPSTADLIMQCKCIFLEATIYLSDQRRQITPKGCWHYSIDDMKHLTVVEKYLDKSYEDLFDYLKKAKQENISLYSSITQVDGSNPKDPGVIKVNIPLSLMMTAQPQSVFDSIAERNEKEKKLPINKKNETAQQIIESLIFEVRGGKTVNTRLDKVPKKIASNVLKYLYNNPLELVEKSMDKFSLSGFKTRINSLSGQRSNPHRIFSVKSKSTTLQEHSTNSISFPSPK